MTDGATSAFLDALADDLRRQLGIAGSVEHVGVHEILGGVALSATIRIASDEIVIRGTGENIVAAYSDLWRSVPQPVLESAFAQVMNPRR